jgi:phosphate-selective porin OprO/OprP
VFARTSIPCHVVRILASCLALPVLATSAIAQTTGETSFDRVWSHATLYENSDGGFVQKFALSGRLQAEAAGFDADEGDFDDATWRRFRFGFASVFVNDWGLDVEADLDLNQSRSDWYQGLTDANITWRPDESTELKILKQSAGFTLDGATSSKRLLTLQRNNLTENLWFTEEYFTGATLKSDFNSQWFYQAGVFASDDAEEIGVTDASYFLFASLDYVLDAGPKLDESIIYLDYVYNDKDAKANTPDLSHVVSLSTRWRAGAWNLHTDLALANGYFDQSDLWGLVLMPFYDVSEVVQLLGRYTYLSSDGDNGLMFNRYEDKIAQGEGDEYHEVYAGLNVFFYGHKLKWQTGLQYTSMDDGADDGGEYDGWGITTGLRIYW